MSVTRKPTEDQITAGAKALVDWNWDDRGRMWRELVGRGDTDNWREQAAVVLKAALKVKT